MVGALNVSWLVARSSGVVAWALIVASAAWGLLLATRVLGRKASPAWLLSLHRFLGALAVVFTVVHVVAIVADEYLDFGLTDVLVPFASSWEPFAVALGIVGMYLLAAVQITSLLRTHMSQTAWRRVHLLSYALFATTTVHALMAGTDANALLPTGVAVIFGAAAVFTGATMWWARTEATRTGSSVVKARVNA
ncbi:MAG: ferric reductase-like transmembrane domain-containing protein [Acidimicrobiia bacterium]|nr:ferric reductase-like transmembrane domain-containing protein [Acidimicrobiia bacterium]